MVKIPSKGSARYLSRKYDKSEDYIRCDGSGSEAKLCERRCSAADKAVTSDLTSAVNHQHKPKSVFLFHIRFTAFSSLGGQLSPFGIVFRKVVGEYFFQAEFLYLNVFKHFVFEFSQI